MHASNYIKVLKNENKATVRLFPAALATVLAEEARRRRLRRAAGSARRCRGAAGVPERIRRQPGGDVAVRCVRRAAAAAVVAGEEESFGKAQKSI